MRRTIPDKDMTVDEIMRRWPATIRLFMQHRMLCVGCPIGAFHTVADACAAHGLDQPRFEADLHEVLGRGGADREPACASAPGGRDG